MSSPRRHGGHGGGTEIWNLKFEISNLRFEIEILGVLRASVVNFNALDTQACRDLGCVETTPVT
jgi:hypothetical protein